MAALLARLDRALAAATTVVAATLLALAVGLAFWQVVTRFLLGDPSAWSEVATRALIIWMVYLGLALAIRSGALIAVELLIGAARGRLRLVMTVLVALTVLVVLLVMLRTGWDMAHRVRAQSLAGVVNPLDGGGVSIAWVYAALPTGAALALPALTARLAEELAAMRARGGAAP